MVVNLSYSSRIFSLSCPGLDSAFTRTTGAAKKQHQGPAHISRNSGDSANFTLASMTERSSTLLGDLRDKRAFPIFADCPYENKANTRYFISRGTGATLPRRHWCFFGEVVDFVVFGRLTIDARDTSGRIIRISFYDDNRGLRFVTNDQVKKGYTVAVLYPLQHWFLDMSQGFRVEDVSKVMILPCSLRRLRSANDRLHDSRSDGTCWTPDCNRTEGLLRCSGCRKALYCSMDHQSAAWKDHKPECKALQAVEWFTQKDWGTYRTAHSF
ncbi:hypothetical protein OBBRIDRAFT_829124 [Obba rivulosa]|uniref:MYND-type domain-containing protein n=1 Tax=Obba rivulosa TaxID=1052685 RepID=A0A8E2ANI3_9APHY|nr:hypothetical protein OBBRIDRAFT_829124 [Obba rivulosa]